MDASLTTRLLKTNTMSEVILHLEHKSRPSKTVVLQLLAEVGLSLHLHWVVNNRPESGNYVPPIPLMIVVYNGTEDWDGEIRFQDLYPFLPEKLRRLVLQFEIIFINLRRFQYGNLPGKPETRAIVESLMRATDGTFIEHLPEVFQHVAEAALGERGRLDLSLNISSYCTWATQTTAQQIIAAMSNVFKGQEFITMTEMIRDEYILEGIAIGEARGELKGKIHAILKLLQIKFNQVPDAISDELNRRTDLVALDSLFELAAQCDSLDAFADGLK